MSMGVNYLNAFLEQESLTMMFVALGLGIIGMAYGKIRTKDSLQFHRWIMTGAVLLNLISIFLVMLPSLYIFYIDPSANVASSFSILQIAHSVIGVPTTTMTLLFVFNDLPQPTQKWMQLTAFLWILSIALGAVVYYTMPS